MDWRIVFSDGVITEVASCDNIIEAINWAIYWNKQYKYSDIVKAERL